MSDGPSPPCPYPLIQLPCGNWVRVDHVTEIKAIKSHEEFHGSPAVPDRIVVLTQGSGYYLHYCESFTEAVRLRDIVAVKVAVAIDAATKPIAVMKSEPPKEGPDFFLT